MRASILMAMLVLGLAGVARAQAPELLPAIAPPPPGEAHVRDLRPTKLERGDKLTVELDTGAPSGPMIILLRPAAVSAGKPEALALRGHGLGDGRVVAGVA